MPPNGNLTQQHGFAGRMNEPIGEGKYATICWVYADIIRLVTKGRTH